MLEKKGGVGLRILVWKRRGGGRVGRGWQEVVKLGLNVNWRVPFVLMFSITCKENMWRMFEFKPGRNQIPKSSFFLF